MIHPHEITIGSLLRTNKGEIIRVESISTKHGHRKVGYHRPNEPCRIKYVRLTQCEGIELTPETLEKNGFEKHGYWVKYIDDIEIDICLSNDIPMYYYGKPWNYCFPHPTYVHELQRALRCAGLHELANGIKI